MSQTLMHKLKLANIVSSHTRDGIANFQYLIIANHSSAKAPLLSSATGRDCFLSRKYSTTFTTGNTTDVLELSSGNAKKVSKFQRRSSAGNLLKCNEPVVRTPPPIINSLPSRKPLHHSTDSQGTLRPNHVTGLDNSIDLKAQLRKAYDDALHYCHCKLIFTSPHFDAFDMSILILLTFYHFSRFLAAKKLPEDVDPTAVFACNRLNLRDIHVYGFDYDYTLVNYKKQLESLIYNLGREVLLEKFKVKN